MTDPGRFAKGFGDQNAVGLASDFHRTARPPRKPAVKPRRNGRGGGHAAAACGSKDVEDVEQDDDRNRDADQPEQDAFHRGRSVALGGLCRFKRRPAGSGSGTPGPDPSSPTRQRGRPSIGLRRGESRDRLSLRYIRPCVTGAWIFFTGTLADRGSDLLVREIGRLRAAVRAARAERGFGIEAWVGVPDPLNCVWTLPEGDRDFATRWGAIKARFTRSLRDGAAVGWNPTLRQSGRVGFQPTVVRSPSKVKKGDAGIWQRRYWEHHIRDEADFAAHVRYCWINPVKHGLVARAVEWPHSSIHRDMSRGLVEPDWSGTVPDGGFGE